MCLSCGCGSPDDNHGDERHITRADLLAAADAAGISPKKASKNIRDATKIAADAGKLAQRDAYLARLDEEIGPPTGYVKRMDARPIP